MQYIQPTRNQQTPKDELEVNHVNLERWSSQLLSYQHKLIRLKNSTS
jgi:hypothetical protein